MRFDLKKPCKDCPFVPNSSTNATLGDVRMEEIVTAVCQDHTFICHKTSDMEQIDEQHCAGALIMLKKEQIYNKGVAVARALRLYDPDRLDMSSEVINSQDYVKAKKV